MPLSCLAGAICCGLTWRALTGEGFECTWEWLSEPQCIDCKNNKQMQHYICKCCIWDFTTAGRLEDVLRLVVSPEE